MQDVSWKNLCHGFEHSLLYMRMHQDQKTRLTPLLRVSCTIQADVVLDMRGGLPTSFLLLGASAGCSPATSSAALLLFCMKPPPKWKSLTMLSSSPASSSSSSPHSCLSPSCNNMSADHLVSSLLTTLLALTALQSLKSALLAST